MGSTKPPYRFQCWLSKTMIQWKCQILLLSSYKYSYHVAIMWLLNHENWPNSDWDNYVLHKIFRASGALCCGLKVKLPVHIYGQRVSCGFWIMKISPLVSEIHSGQALVPFRAFRALYGPLGMVWAQNDPFSVHLCPQGFKMFLNHNDRPSSYWDMSQTRLGLHNSLRPNDIQLVNWVIIRSDNAFYL